MSFNPFKQRLIEKYQRHNIVWVFLLMLFYLRKENRQPQISFLRVFTTFFFHYIFIFFNAIKYFLYKVFNALRELYFVQRIRKAILTYFTFFKKNTYIIPPPLNLIKDDLWLFKGTDFYYLKPAKILRINNVYTYLATEFGIVYKHFFLNKNSIHGKWDKRNVHILSIYYNMVFTHHISNIYKNNEFFFNFKNDRKYVLIHNWFNYYHWITESLCRLNLINNSSTPYTIVLPETLKEIDYVQSSLNLLNCSTNIKYVPNEVTLRFDSLYLVSQKKYCDNYDPTQLKILKEMLSKNVKKESYPFPVTEERIFVRRSRARRRSIINEEEVLMIIKNYNFKAIDFEDYSFEEQIAMMSRCRYLIGIHGSGLTNMIFMPNNSVVFELHRIVRNSKDHHSKVYWRMAGALKHKYYYQFCDIDPLNDTFFTTNIKVDPVSFEANLKLLLVKNER